MNRRHKKISLLAAFVVFWWIVFFSWTPPVVKAQAMEEYEIPQPPSYTLVEPPMSIPPEGATVTPMRIGQRVTEVGVLYNQEANAWIQTEYKRINAAWFVEAETRMALLKAWSLRELNLMHNAALHNERVLNLRIESLQEDNLELRLLNEEIAKKVGWSKREKFVAIMSSVGGVVVGALAGYMVGNISN